jgi:hypothetical protein
MKDDSGPICGGRAKTVVNTRCSTHIEPSRGILRDNDCRVLGKLASEDEPLLISTAQRCRPDIGSRCSNAVFDQELSRSTLRLFPFYPPPSNPRRVRSHSEYNVLREREIGNQSFGRAVFRNEPNRLLDLQPSAEGCQPSGYGTQKLTLSVSFHRRDSQNLTGPHHQRRLPQCDPVTAFPRHLQGIEPNQLCTEVGLEAWRRQFAAQLRKSCLTDHCTC